MTDIRTPVPDPATLTASPLRNRLRVALDARPAVVWSLVGDLTRYPEYSAGLGRVDAALDPAGACTGYVCFFRPVEEGGDVIAHREVMRWFEPGVGYASEGEEPNAFGLRGSITMVTLEAAGSGTTLAWAQYYDADDLIESTAMFAEALSDIGANLVARFGGEVLENAVVE